MLLMPLQSRCVAALIQQQQNVFCTRIGCRSVCCLCYDKVIVSPLLCRDSRMFFILESAVAAYVAYTTTKSLCRGSYAATTEYFSYMNLLSWHILLMPRQSQCVAALIYAVTISFCCCGLYVATIGKCHSIIYFFCCRGIFSSTLGICRSIDVLCLNKPNPIARATSVK